MGRVFMPTGQKENNAAKKNGRIFSSEDTTVFKVFLIIHSLRGLPRDHPLHWW